MVGDDHPGDHYHDCRHDNDKKLWLMFKVIMMVDKDKKTGLIFLVIMIKIRDDDVG